MTAYAYVLENVCPAYGWQGGPAGNTEIVEQRNRHERRNAIGDEAIHTFSLPFANIQKQNYLLYLKHVHMVMYGRTHSFLVQDWLDYQGADESLGAAPSGTTSMQLRKGYHIRDRNGGLIASRYRDITKPDPDTVVVQMANGIGGWNAVAGEVDPITGLFTPDSAWTEGRAVRASFEFWVPVRFDNDDLPMTIDTRGEGEFLVSGSVELREVFGE